MNVLQNVRDSVETMVSIGFAKNVESAALKHIYHSKLTKIPMTLFHGKIENFNPKRLQPTPIKAFPIKDRPRGKRDIMSVKYHQKRIQQKKDMMPIIIVQQKSTLTLLDGAHRIVAHHIHGSKFIDAYLINTE